MANVYKPNVHYFESETMRGLYSVMAEWQEKRETRLLSMAVGRDGNNFCCIALAGPAEVVVTNPRGDLYAEIEGDAVKVWNIGI